MQFVQFSDDEAEERRVRHVEARPGRHRSGSIKPLVANKQRVVATWAVAWHAAASTKPRTRRVCTSPFLGSAPAASSLPAAGPT